MKPLAMEMKFMASGYHLHSRFLFLLPRAYHGAPHSVTPPTSLALQSTRRRVRNCQRARCSSRANPKTSEGSSSSESSNELSNESSEPWLYGSMASLATAGFVETAYLTFTKLTGGAVLCPMVGTTCNDVLNSEYADFFGIPLSMVGMVSYGSVIVLGLLGVTKTPIKVSEIDLTPLLLLNVSGAMATASSYFMYILATKFEGASCTYCVISALLSLSLLLLSLRLQYPSSLVTIETWFGKFFLQKFSSENVKKVVSIQLAVTAAVVVALSTAYGQLDSASAGSTDIDLPPVEPEVTTVSTPDKLSLAKHLQSLGAKMYGAFWCSHCHEQKQMFGREALKYLEYVECYPEGYRKGVQIAKACTDANIQGFPSWVIKGKVYSGEQELTELARISGFDGFTNSSSSHVTQ